MFALMGIRQIKTCDVTGEELPDNATAERMTWAGYTYDLYLSDAGREKLTTFLEPILEGAQQVSSYSSAPRQTRRTAAKRDDLDQIRAWARENNFTVSDRGRIKKEIMEAYDAAQQ